MRRRKKNYHIVANKWLCVSIRIFDDIDDDVC